MLELLFPFILAASNFVSVPGGLFEPIKISSGLEISAQYLPAGSTIQSEAMALTIEDFAILQAEVEGSSGACELRISDMSKHHEEFIKDAQRRCEERNASYKVDLEKSLELNKKLQEDLKRSRADHRFQKWVNVGIVVGGGIATAIVLTR